MSVTAGLAPVRYLQVASSLAEAIEAGVHPVGSSLPSEASLCRQFGISRYTVREALRRLEIAGLIERSQGRESRVLADRSRPRFILSGHRREDVLRYAAETVLELRSGPERTRPDVAERLHLPTSWHWVRFGGRRSDPEGRVIGHVEVHLRRGFERVLARTRRVDTAVFGLVAGRHGLTVSAIDQVISATTISPELAPEVDCRPGEPALEIVRRFTAREVGLFEVSVSVHPASRFSYAFELVADQAPSRTGSGTP